nr:hypothetical protein [Kibdelosporangium sp. MJ126-NF4]CTQ97556.1 hypothetical protein [Kibdelosporangium sp. MJ126-NF4]
MSLQAFEDGVVMGCFFAPQAFSLHSEHRVVLREADYAATPGIRA